MRVFVILSDVVKGLFGCAVQVERSIPLVVIVLMKGGCQNGIVKAGILHCFEQLCAKADVCINQAVNLVGFVLAQIARSQMIDDIGLA